VSSGTTFNGNNFASNVITLNGGSTASYTFTSGTVIQGAGSGYNCLSMNAGTTVINGSSVVQNCGGTTSDAAIYVSGGSFTANTATIGPNPGDGLQITGTNATINTVSSPTGHPNGGYAVHLSSSTTVFEKTGTNTNWAGSTASVSVCGTSKTWAAVDSSGSGGITVSTCTIIPT
jgi:hypothetical protein